MLFMLKVLAEYRKKIFFSMTLWKKIRSLKEIEHLYESKNQTLFYSFTLII